MTDQEIEALSLHRAVAWHKKEIAGLEEQIEANNEYMARSGRHAHAANDHCRSLIFHHQWAIDAILALAPMSPLQAALEVPDVRALRDALDTYRCGCPDGVCLAKNEWDTCGAEARAALAALEKHRD